MSEKEMLLKELAELLKKYNASIAFDVDDSSDLNGITGEGIEILIGGKPVEKFQYHWEIDASDFEHK
jgi:hypothetical protein